MSNEVKRVYSGQAKYIPSAGVKQEYPLPKTDVSSLSSADLIKIKVELERPLVFDDKVLRSLLRKKV
ncbi:MAG: hypothetical protein FJ126_02160 [Deltaproteobacteria bacterium]|nr:hypothetical protein [Deltaproteobacteria bacterium]